MTRWIAFRLLLVAIGICIPIFGAKLLERVFESKPSPRISSPSDK